MTFDYQVFKVAAQRYGKPSSELNDTELSDVTRIAGRKAKIDQMVLLSPEAARVVISKGQIDVAVQAIAERYSHQDEFEYALDANGLNELDFRKSIEKDLKVEAVLEYISAQRQPVTETDVSLFYYMNSAKFDQPETRIARHILVTINDDIAENTRSESLKKISQIATRLQKKPDRFEEQALKHSECPTALQGGMLGRVKKGLLYPEIEQVLFELPVGKVSNVVETEVGFHVVRCDEISPAGILPLEDVSEKLHEYLEERNKKQIQRKWLDALMHKFQITNGGELAHG